MSERYIKPDWFTRMVFNPFVAAMTRAGVSVWGSRVLRVRGRKSGEWRSAPVNVLTFEGKRYLVAPRGHTQWVRNIRVSNEAELQLGSKVERIRVSEVPDADRVPILRAYLKKWVFEVGVFFEGVKAESPDSELLRIAPDHPVFLIQSSP